MLVCTKLHILMYGPYPTEFWKIHDTMYGITFFTVLYIPQKIETFVCLIVSWPKSAQNDVKISMWTMSLKISNR